MTSTYDDSKDSGNIYSVESASLTTYDKDDSAMMAATATAFAACVYRKEILEISSPSSSKKEPPLYLSVLAIVVPSLTMFAGVKLVKLFTTKV